MDITLECREEKWAKSKSSRSKKRVCRQRRRRGEVERGAKAQGRIFAQPYVLAGQRQDLSPLRQRTHLPAQGQRVLHKGDRSDLPHLPLHKNFAPELYLGRFFIYQTSKLL